MTPMILITAYLLIGLIAAVWVWRLNLATGEPPGMKPILFLMVLTCWALYPLGLLLAVALDLVHRPRSS